MSIIAFDDSTYLGVPKKDGEPTPQPTNNQYNNYNNNYNSQPQPDNNVMDNPQPTPAMSSFCSNCGTQLSADTTFCPNCGTPKSN